MFLEFKTLKKKKFDIFKTFEIFNSEALSIIKQRILKFVLIEADNMPDKQTSITAEIDKNNDVQLSILNNTKFYNLLSCTWHKRQQKLNNENIKC